jgi:hypothetical protein
VLDYCTVAHASYVYSGPWNVTIELEEIILPGLLLADEEDVQRLLPVQARPGVPRLALRRLPVHLGAGQPAERPNLQRGH